LFLFRITSGFSFLLSARTESITDILFLFIFYLFFFANINFDFFCINCSAGQHTKKDWVFMCITHLA
jgi:hypothetical protein